MRPIFEAWFKPFEDLGAATISDSQHRRDRSHQSFDAVGLPAFSSSRIRSSTTRGRTTRTWTSTIACSAADMMQMAAIVASFVYNAANRPDLLPRKPMPSAP